MQRNTIRKRININFNGNFIATFKVIKIILEKFSLRETFEFLMQIEI